MSFFVLCIRDSLPADVVFHLRVHAFGRRGPYG